MKKRTKNPEDIFIEVGFKTFIEDLDNQLNEIQYGYRSEINIGQSIGSALILASLVVIFY
jgi:hypothetical protein